MTPGGSRRGFRGHGGAEHLEGVADSTRPRLMSRTEPLPLDRPMRAACRARPRRDPIAPAGTLGRRTRRRTSLGPPSRSSLRRTLARHDLERPPRPLHRSRKMQNPRSAAQEPWRLPSLEHAAASRSQLTHPEPDPVGSGAPGLTTTLWKEAARRLPHPPPRLRRPETRFWMRQGLGAAGTWSGKDLER